MRIAIMTALVLVGCTNQTTTWQQPGTSVTRAQAETLRCQAQAESAFPVRIGPSVATIGISIGQSVCRGGACVGVNLPVSKPLSQRDMNAGPRDKAFRACMIEKGFMPKVTPVCRAGDRVLPLASQPAAMIDTCTRSGILYQRLPG